MALTCEHLYCYNGAFPKIYHLGIDARIVLEQNKFSKKATSNRTVQILHEVIETTSIYQQFGDIWTNLYQTLNFSRFVGEGGGRVRYKFDQNQNQTFE